VTPEQAETLTLASSQGRVQLVLRNGTDQRIAKTKGRATSELYGRAKPKPVRRTAPRQVVRRVAPLPPAPVEPPPDEIVIIRGTQKTVQVVNASPSGD